jgi:hypothetical protein
MNNPQNNPRIATNYKRMATNLRRHSWIIFVAISGILLFVGIRGVQAAEIFFGTKTNEARIGEQFQVDVILNTEGEQINAVEGKIVFPDKLLEVKEIRDGNSIVSFWIDKPKVESDKIFFSGIIPGGYNDSRGLIFSITFLAKKEGSGAIKFGEVKALRNDGQGTEVPLTISNFNFTVRETAKSTGQMPTAKEDRDLPEEFAPQIAADPAIFEGKWFLVFAAQDKGSGIDYYAIHETTRKRTRIDTKDWQVAESPYVLKDQNLKSYIYVKAVDKAGNERIVSLTPRYPLKWYEKWENWIIIIIGLVIVGLVTIARRLRKFLISKS